MPESYKLRLSDGTLLVVDHDGLETWLVDTGAMVLGPGFEKWRSLRAFVAAEGRSSRAAAAPRPAPAASVPSEAAPADSPPPIGEPRDLLVLADDVAGENGARRPPARQPDDDVPVIPLKPMDDAAPRGTVWNGDDDGDGPAYLPDLPAQKVIDPRALAAMIRLGYLLSPWVKRLEGQVRRWQSRPKRYAGHAWTARLGAAVDRVGASAHRLRASARSLRTALVRLASRERKRIASTAPPVQSAPPPPDPVPAVREPLPAPPSIQELPVLRLADADEPEEPETLFGEEDHGGGAVWAWTRRVLLAGSLVAVVVAGTVTRETWLPEAGFWSRALFGEVDSWTRSREQGERRSRALREARGALPYLTPATLQLVVSAASPSALEPPEVFRLAHDAADRGLGALPPAQAKELMDLKEQLFDALPPDERDRARGYDRARAHRATLAFEDRDALALFARGAQAMPYASRARYEALSADAIAAGLRVPPGAVHP